MQLNYREAKPVYQQIKDNVLRLLRAGAILPEEPVMPVRELSSRLAVNPNAIERAYRELEQEGYLYRAKNGHFFVSGGKTGNERRREELFEQLDALLEELDEYAVSGEELVSYVVRRTKGDRR